jgi:hypothetical protein
LRKVTADLVAANGSNAALAYWVADDYLRATGLVLLQWASDRLAASHVCAGSQAAYADWIAPELGLRMTILNRQLSK